MKKAIALLLCLVLSLSLAAFAQAEGGVPNLANTYYTYGYDVGFYVDYFFHFYDEIPGFGKVFYAGWVQNQASVNGTYEVIAEEREYACWPDRVTQTSAAEGDAVPTGTAPYTIVFYDLDGKEIDRCAFDGEHLYIVRFLPETAGEWHWKVTGAVNAEGTEICEAAENAHGLVKAVDTHFEYEDGTLFIPFGTTVYALAHQDDALVEQTLESLKAAPFNKVRMCVFPKHYDYNHNEPPCYAFEKNADGGWDVNRPCIAFWHRFEKILKRIAEMDIQIDLILFHPYDRWGFSELAQRDNLIYLDYLLRRLSAFPNIWWSLANEYDLNMKKSLHDWEEIEEYVAGNDPFHHLLSNHNCMCFWDNTRKNITHASLQTKGLSEIPRWIREYKKPVVIDECCYEGNLPHFWGSISGMEMVRRFWRCYASGAYCTHGETFLSDDEILWWARGGVLKGESPKRIAFLRQIMEGLPGPLTPKEGGFLDLARSDEPVDMELIPQEMRGFFKAFSDSIHRMPEKDRTAHLGGEHAWESRCGEEAYLTYFDLQCYGEQTVNLPKDKVYQAELIDVWNMTRETIAENICGETKLTLPGRDNLALLITRIQ